MPVKPFCAGSRARAIAVLLLSGACLLLCLVLPPAAAARAAMTRDATMLSTPKPGSPERATILKAVRAPVQAQVGQPVIFHEVSVRVQGGWAFVNALARDSQGELLFTDVRTQALLRRSKSADSGARASGSWRILYWDVAGDAGPVAEALKKYPHAPRPLFEVSPEEFESGLLPLPVTAAPANARF